MLGRLSEKGHAAQSLRCLCSASHHRSEVRHQRCSITIIKCLKIHKHADSFCPRWTKCICAEQDYVLRVIPITPTIDLHS